LAVSIRAHRLVVEMNAGQMVEDVRLAVAGRVPVQFYGRMGGIVPFPDEILSELEGMFADRLQWRNVLQEQRDETSDSCTT
jgi:hypothetical protein